MLTQKFFNLNFAGLMVLIAAAPLAGCSTHKHYLDTEVHLEVEEVDPLAHLDPLFAPIAHATSKTMAIRAIREALQEVRDTHLEPKNNLRQGVSEALEINPFSAVQRSRMALLDRFFDLEWLRASPTPDSFDEIEAHLQRLNDAKLAAQAYGDEQLAMALEKRMNGCRVALKVGRELTLMN